MERADAFLKQRHQYYKDELMYYLDIEEKDAEVVSCYPNPFADEILLRYPSDDVKAQEVAIYDVLGRKVFSVPFEAGSGDEITIKPQLPAGVYVLKVGIYSQRIVRY